MYKVYYLNVYVRSFRTRDLALDFVIKDSNAKSHAYGDYEILDGSDFL